MPTKNTEQPTIYAAVAAAMADIRAVRKGDKNQQQGFNFRGIDAVMNAVGPAFRDHGLFVLPEVINHHGEQIAGRNGKPMMSVLVTVRYTIAHTSGETITGTAVGEATDPADKATAKAMSVAFRTFLLQSLVLPTDERDPDHDNYERGQRQAPRMMDTPGWSMETATKPQLMQAMREAREAGNREEYEKIRAVGQRRFPTHPTAGGTPEQADQNQTHDPVQAAGENQEQ